jgi:hypothetical protein
VMSRSLPRNHQTFADSSSLTCGSETRGPGSYVHVHVQILAESIDDAMRATSIHRNGVLPRHARCPTVAPRGRCHDRLGSCCTTGHALRGAGDGRVRVTA